MTRFIREVTFGHGSFGKACVLCGANNYLGELTHKDGCLYLAILKDIMGEEYSVHE